MSPRSLYLDNIIDYGIKDPKGKPIEEVRKIRNEIERRVISLVEETNEQLAEANYLVLEIFPGIFWRIFQPTENARLIRPDEPFNKAANR